MFRYVFSRCVSLELELILSTGIEVLLAAVCSQANLANRKGRKLCCWMSSQPTADEVLLLREDQLVSSKEGSIHPSSYCTSSRSSGERRGHVPDCAKLKQLRLEIIDMEPLAWLPRLGPVWIPSPRPCSSDPGERGKARTQDPARELAHSGN